MDNVVEFETIDNEFIKEYIKLYDEAMDEILSLLKTDTLVRFYQLSAWNNN